MKNGIFKVRIFQDESLDRTKIVKVDASTIHDDKSFIETIGLSFGMNKEHVERINNLAWFNDDLGDFLYNKYAKKGKEYVLLLENWSSVKLDKSPNMYNPRSKTWRKKEDYLDELKVVIEFLSEYDPTDPDEELIDFTVFVVD